MNRYVGEIVSEAEAEMRQNDAYLFSLDDKVKNHSGRKGGRKEEGKERMRKGREAGRKRRGKKGTMEGTKIRSWERK